MEDQAKQTSDEKIFTEEISVIELYRGFLVTQIVFELGILMALGLATEFIVFSDAFGRVLIGVGVLTTIALVISLVYLV